MKVLLINPWSKDIFPPPGLGYIQAALKHWNVEVKALNIEEAMLEDDEYDIVGVSFHSFSVRQAGRIREKFRCHLICGGHHPSALPGQLLGIGYDQVVIGEGENAIIDIIQGNRNKIIYAEDCQNRYFHSINDYPLPDYSGLLFSKEVYGVPVISSRGCPYSCSFCASANFWHHKWFMRNASNVLYEIERNIQIGNTTWMYEDDNFVTNKSRALEICEGTKRLGNFTWQCAARADSLQDEDLCKSLKSAGCKTVWLGVESLSQDSLNRCGKHTTVEKTLNGITTAESFGLETMSQFIIGLPGDTFANINETILNIKRSKIRRKGCNIAWILPGTDIYQKAKEWGFSDDTYLNGGSVYYTYEQSLQTLQHWDSLIQAA